MEDYFDAANRHHADAMLLQTQVPPRLANASHLFGIAAECAVKTVIQNDRSTIAGVTVRGHINQIRQKFIACEAIKGKPSFQADMLRAITAFEEWDVSQRYCSQTDDTFTVARLVVESKATAKLLSLRDSWLQRII